MEAGLDTGPVYHRVVTPLQPNETGGSLHNRLALLGAQALLEALPGVCDGSRQPEIQNNALATYAHKLTKDEARIDWTQPAPLIERQIRAFNPWPVAHTPRLMTRRCGFGKQKRTQRYSRFPFHPEPSFPPIKPAFALPLATVCCASRACNPPVKSR
jgi:hypothetical protein